MTATERMLLALEGLSVGDAFGEQFFGRPEVVVPRIDQRVAPSAERPWPWTDDTAMALSIADVLRAHGRIDRDALAAAFAARYRADPMRGYGGTAHGILQAIGQGVPWSAAAGRVSSRARLAATAFRPRGARAARRSSYERSRRALTRAFARA